MWKRKRLKNNRFHIPARHACCVLSRLRCNGHSLLLGSYFSRIGRIENPSCSACGYPPQDTSHLILHCPATDSVRRSLFGDFLVQTLGSFPASGASWSSAMPPSLGRGWLNNNNNILRKNSKTVELGPEAMFTKLTFNTRYRIKFLTSAEPIAAKTMMAELLTHFFPQKKTLVLALLNALFGADYKDQKSLQFCVKRYEKRVNGLLTRRDLYTFHYLRKET